MAGEEGVTGGYTMLPHGIVSGTGGMAFLVSGTPWHFSPVAWASIRGMHDCRGSLLGVVSSNITFGMMILLA